MRNGRGLAAASGCWCGSPTTASCCAPAGLGPSRPAGGERDPGGSGVQLPPDKTRIACLTRGREGVNCLGFHLHKVASWRRRGRWYLQRWPSDRAMAQLRASSREATSRRLVGHSIAWVVAALNRVLRGWGAYFRYGNSARKFAQIDGYVHERLAIFAGIKHGRHGRNYHRCTWGWFTSLGV
jgi:RNA-directed DNA polymerase